MIDWNDAFLNGDYIPGAAEYVARWTQAAAAFRDAHDAKTLGVPYGPAPRQAYDIFRAPNPKGTVIFVHGGYWHQLDRSFWSHLATGPLAHGWSVAFPGYTLAPEVRIRDITAEIANAVAAIAESEPGALRLTGHSAGGHLVSRMACDGVLPDGLRRRIEHTVSISGVHHLPPLLETQMNDTLHLDRAEAEAESPALLSPAPDTRICAWVGAAERPEFLRQTRMLAERWALAGVDARDIYAAGDHHFSVIEPLADPDSPLTRELLS